MADLSLVESLEAQRGQHEIDRAAQAQLSEAIDVDVANYFIDNNGLRIQPEGRTDTIGYTRTNRDTGAFASAQIMGYHPGTCLNDLSGLVSLKCRDANGDEIRGLMYGGQLVEIDKYGGFDHTTEKAPELLAIWQEAHASDDKSTVTFTGGSPERVFRKDRITLAARIVLQQAKLKTSRRWSRLIDGY